MLDLDLTQPIYQQTTMLFPIRQTDQKYIHVIVYVLMRETPVLAFGCRLLHRRQSSGIPIRSVSRE